MDPALIKTLTLACFGFVNAAGLILMGVDKLSATRGYNRIPEHSFFVASLLGGFIGVVLGMFIFHHKTSKRSFQFKIAVASIVFALAAFFLGFI